MVINSLNFNKPWKLISNSWNGNKNFTIIDSEKLPLDYKKFYEEKGDDYDYYDHEVYKNRQAIDFNSNDRDSNRLFVVPLGNEGKLLQIRLIYPYKLEELSDQELLLKHKYSTEKSFLDNGFTKLKVIEENMFESKSGNMTFFDHMNYRWGDFNEPTRTIFGQELLDCSKNDYERMGNLINGESLTLEPDINPYGFSVSWFPGKYLIHEPEICNPETDECIDYGFMISPTHYFGEFIDLDDENFFMTLDKFFDDLDKPFLKNNK